MIYRHQMYRRSPVTITRDRLRQLLRGSPQLIRRGRGWRQWQIPGGWVEIRTPTRRRRRYNKPSPLTSNPSLSSSLEDQYAARLPALLKNKLVVSQQDVLRTLGVAPEDRTHWVKSCAGRALARLGWETSWGGGGRGRLYTRTAKWRSPCGIHLVKRRGPCRVCAHFLEKIKQAPIRRGVQKWGTGTGQWDV